MIVYLCSCGFAIYVQGSVASGIPCKSDGRGSASW
jgi:hypothetical protein